MPADKYLNKWRLLFLYRFSKEGTCILRLPWQSTQLWSGPYALIFGRIFPSFSHGPHLVFMLACFVKLGVDQILFLCLLWFTCIFRYADEHLLRTSWKIPCFIPWMTVFFTSIPLKICNAAALKMGCVLCINSKLFTNNVECKNSVIRVLLTNCNFQFYAASNRCV